MEFRKEFAIRSFAALGIGVSSAVSAETVLQTVNNRTPIVEAQTTSTPRVVQRFDLSFDLPYTCVSPTINVPVTGYLELKEGVPGIPDLVNADFRFTGNDAQGRRYVYSGRSASQFEFSPNRNFSFGAAQSLINAEGQLQNEIVNSVFGMVDGRLIINNQRDRCVGKPVVRIPRSLLAA